MIPMASVSGLASGVQWHDLIDQVIATERLRRIQPLESEIDANRKRIEAWNNFRTLVTRLETAARQLQKGEAYATFVASGGISALSGRSLVTATAGSGASPSSYGIEVQQLARAEKLASRAVMDATVSLNSIDPAFTGGTVTINGREVVIEATDTLEQIRDRINAANTGTTPSGVSASILKVGANEYRLILTSERTGAAGIRIEEDGSGVLSQLGISSVSRSAAFQDVTSPLASLLGLSPPPAVRRIVIEGREITVDLVNDSLQSVLNRIRAAAVDAGEDPDVVARIVTDAEGSRLEVRGSVTARVDDADTQAILAALGFTREGLSVAGTDAAIRIDGFDIHRSTNAISDIVPGVTLNLQGAEPGTVVELNVARDVDAMVEAVKEFAAAYTELRNFVDKQRADGPLRSNSTLRGAMQSFTNAILTPIDGLETAFTRAAEVGLSLTRTGTLEVNEAKLREVLATNPADVHALFAGVAGEATVEGLAGMMVTAATSITRSGDGTVAIQVDSLDRSIATLTRRLNDAEARLELRQQALIEQFMRMETALSTLQAQGNWLQQQLDALRPRSER